MAPVFNTSLSEGTAITLPLYGAVGITVDWGDTVSKSATILERFLGS